MQKDMGSVFAETDSRVQLEQVIRHEIFFIMMLCLIMCLDFIVNFV